ncbi:MAG: DinB family protein [Gemmatimonadales bacterium]
MSNLAFFRQCYEHECARHQSVVAAAIPDQLDWRPEPRSRSARELIGHLIGHDQDMIELIDAGVIHHRMQVPFTTLDDAVSILTRSQTEACEKLGAFPEERWDRVAEFRVGDRVIWSAPTSGLMWTLLFDSIHHRGQLSTYLRPMGGKVPAIYGPSADTAMGA